MSRAAASRTERPKCRAAEDVAALLAVPVERVVLGCRAAVAVGRASFFWGCWEEGGTWWIPERSMVRVAVGLELQHFTVAEVAALAGLSAGALRKRVQVVPGGVSMDRGRRPGMVGARLFFAGAEGRGDVRIPAAEVDRFLSGLTREEAA